jgi:oxalate decarboxylase/phosphoglucose isomerase-like protein (cupin superfamily)
MYVHENAERPQAALPGLRRTLLASWQDGLWLLSLERHSIAPGAGTALHRHFCEEVAVVLVGRGELHVEDTVQPFGPDSTLVIPLGANHRIVNTGAAPLLMLAAFSATPVETVDALDQTVVAMEAA